MIHKESFEDDRNTDYDIDEFEKFIDRLNSVKEQTKNRVFSILNKKEKSQ